MTIENETSGMALAMKKEIPPVVVTTNRIDDQHRAFKFGPMQYQHPSLGEYTRGDSGYASHSRLPYTLVTHYMELEREAMAALSRRFVRKTMPVIRVLAQLYLGKTVVRREPDPAFYDAHAYVCRNNLWKSVSVKFWVLSSTRTSMYQEDDGLVELNHDFVLPIHKPTEKIVEYAAQVFRWLKNEES